MIKVVILYKSLMINHYNTKISKQYVSHAQKRHLFYINPDINSLRKKPGVSAYNFENHKHKRRPQYYQRKCGLMQILTAFFYIKDCLKFTDDLIL